MSANIRRVTHAGLVLCLFLGISVTAQAFFPMGGFNSYNQLVYSRWSTASLNDANHDGDISGDNEGVEILLEGGPNGFTDDELEIVKEAFRVWQDVPTAGVGFHFIGPTSSALYPVLDLYNHVMMLAPDEPASSLVPTGVLGVTITHFVLDDSYYTDTDGNIGFLFSGGQIMEADMIIDAAAHRPQHAGDKAEYNLKSTVVHEAGHFIGLDHTPLNNLQIALVNGAANLAESPVVSLRYADGVLHKVGATPTMFPIAFFTDDGKGNYTDGGVDLAPDDIAGVSFLYPRGSQDAFFTLSQEVRTHSRPNLPSLSLIGAHVVAWCDVDNDPSTTRVPLFSTLSGLYQYQPLLGGKFIMPNLFKELEAVGVKGSFSATYTFTMNQLNQAGLQYQSPPGYTAADFASIENGVLDSGSNSDSSGVSTTGGSNSDSGELVYPSEVFHESGNLYDINKADIGTPLFFDRSRSAIVSVDSGKTLATMLPGIKPMFGDVSGICPLNIIISASLSSSSAATLRAFRDNVLLHSSVGTLLVDVYYQMGPSLASFLTHHPKVLHIAQTTFRGIEWLCMHYLFVLTLIVGAFMAIMFRRYRKTVAIALLVLTILLMGTSAHASVMNLSDEQMVAYSDAVITGSVTNVSSQMGEILGYKGVITDVTIKISDGIKGTLNIDSPLTIRTLGGRVGNINAKTDAYPTFAVGEEVVLFLKYRETLGFQVVAGSRGKFDVETDSLGKKYMAGSSVESDTALARTVEIIRDNEAKAKKSTNINSDDRISLDEFKQYFREIVKKEKK